MNTILNSIKESVKALTDNIKAASVKLYEEANIRKEKLAAAIEDMRVMKQHMKEFASIKNGFADIISTCCDMEVAGEFVEEMLSDMNVFEANVEKFNGYCDACGCELTIEDEAHCTEADEFVCDECWNEINEPEQLEISVEEKSE